MLKTLIVDDEKLVRSELKKLVNWGDYGLEIVGEAENGRAAINFMSNNPVDLMISDLSMPGLSGMEFLQTVKNDFPTVKIVVMTMHQEFEFVQQAIRMGAIDYITKTQIEKEKLGDILKNIVKKLATVNGEDFCDSQNSTIIYEICNAKNSPKTDLSAFASKNEFLLLEEGIYLTNTIPVSDLPTQFVALHFKDTFGVSFGQLLSRVKECAETELFYSYSPDCREYSLEISKDYLPISIKRDDVAAVLKRMDWLLDDAIYDRLGEEIPKLCLTRDELVVFLYQPYLTCAPYLKLEPADYFTNTTDIFWWYQWVAWIDELRKNTSQCLWPVGSTSYVMHKTLAFIDKNYTTDIQLSQMLAMAGMSKSSFCSAFKEKTGKTFVTYIKLIRIEMAKKLLSQTDTPISSIGEQVGYPDERYFRRVFMEITQTTPAAYRKDTALANSTIAKRKE